MGVRQGVAADPQTHEALDLLDRARKALDEKKISAWLEDARGALARGDIGTAPDLIDQALAVNRDSKQALTIRDEMLELRRERERERDQTVRSRPRPIARGPASKRVTSNQQSAMPTMLSQLIHVT